MIIGSIRDGIVIDHIPAGRGMELYTYLKLGDLDCEVALIKNAISEKMQKKDIIKIGAPIELDYAILGFIDRQITVNIIVDGQRAKKFHPAPPQTITQLIRCKNPRCITSCEQELPHVFRLSDAEHGVYRCLYCETKAEK
ncbi:MAG: aspartate carbamoyltransferase regulatory subunit [Clostridia bacterium]|nr:aspartate carbamoyltransferase regulatory subunit [Clostridia bacterium]